MKPHNIPSSPQAVYKNDGFSGYRDWLGNSYLPFKEQRDFVRKLDLKNSMDWRKYCTSGKKPMNISSRPAVIFKNKGWKGYKDWLGTEEE